MEKDFRPISCCTVVYKTITRIITTRLSHIFSSIISPSHTAFVKGRNIVNNTLLAQEIVKGYSRKSLSPRCAIKIDLQKAFDSMNWDFLMVVLEAVGLHVKFCSWIRACVTSSQFSVSLNGSLVGYFRGAREVRKGDPLSPYLFVLVMNVLSSLLDVYAKRGIFRYHPKCKRISLTHFCFTDDLLVFYHGSMDAVMGVLSTLELIQYGMGFRVGILPVKYLGIPLVTRKLTSKDCSALVTKIKEKLCEGSLWIAWLNAYCFRIDDFWNAGCKSHFSWIIVKLFKMRSEVVRLFCSSSNWDQIRASWLWDKVRSSSEKVPWHRLVWFPGHIPKFSLISWMAILDRLPTKDRLARFGIVIDSVPTGWNDLLHWLLLNLKGKSLMVHILKLAWTGFIYCIWEEQNRRHFRGVHCSVDTVVGSVKESVRIKLFMSSMNSLDTVNRQLCIDWGLI
ncbi:uncharacterized protein LOC120209551 [Hibiscus syriacus]|uniref:uncharacterized protein LOC120209551 n=1 Tax=Hibiscus syriacus TaxID=106335 RepID=UPI001922C81D|nr:uncharacterized protein LOC120209551 [Hibiscus syriacus]